MAELEDITGVSETRAENLRDEGYTTVDDVAEADAPDLEDVHGVGEATAYDLIDAAQEVITDEHSVEEAEEEEDEEEREDVDLEDIEEINDEPPEDYAAGEPEEPDDDEEEEVEQAEEVEEEDDEEEELAESYEVEIEVPSDEHYDYFLKALLDAKLERSSSNVDRHRAVADFIEDVRPLGGAGTVTTYFTSFELNTVHAAVQQAESRHQQNRQNDAFEAMRDMKAQIDEARAEYVF